MKIFKINILEIIFTLSIKCTSLIFHLLLFLVFENIALNLKLSILRLYRKKNHTLLKFSNYK
jgi:hypothetical protein